MKAKTYVSRKISRRTARSTVIQPRGGAWSGRTISSCSPSRHHYRSPPDSRSSPRRISPTACLELSVTRETRLFPAQLSSRISLSPSRRKRPAVIRAKESARAPPPPCTCQARDSASTMHRHARKLQFRRDKTGPLVRVAHISSCTTSPRLLSAARIEHYTGLDHGTINNRHKAHRRICNLREHGVRKSATRPPDANRY